MNFKKILNELNIVAQCRRYGLSIWQCPSFIFLVMGLVIIATSLLTYNIGTRYIADPELVALVVLVVSAILFILSSIITKSFEKLAEASRMKSEFISIASHQLRAPLSNLKWTIELLMSGRLGKIDEKQVEYYKALLENSERMGELISNFLMISRIETATLTVKKSETCLAELAKKLISNLETLAKASNVKIKLDSQPDLPKAFVDPSQIKVVIENLLDNAVRYTNKRGLIEVSIKKKNSNIYFEVKDDGVGIPKEDQKYIFQKFFRSGNVLKRQTLGSGLGLYLSKSIVEKSGGKLGFSSQEGKGSTFWFTLPIK